LPQDCKGVRAVRTACSPLIRSTHGARISRILV
jgi:hypothetical protein